MIEHYFNKAVEKYFKNVNTKNQILDKKEQFFQYLEIISKWKDKINITGFSKEEFLFKGILEPLIIFDEFSGCYGEITDIGSGAGIPSISYSIFFPDITVNCIEINKKKLAFLNFAKFHLNLKNLIIKKEIPKKNIFVVSRAFMNISEFIKFLDSKNISYKYLIHFFKDNYLELPGMKIEAKVEYDNKYYQIVYLTLN